jgi:hypothetical protein
VGPHHLLGRRIAGAAVPTGRRRETREAGRLADVDRIETASLPVSCTSLLATSSAFRAVREQFHREQKRDRRPTCDQHRLPRQSWSRRDVRRQGHRDPYAERRPQHPPAAPAGVGTCPQQPYGRK